MTTRSFLGHGRQLPESVLGHGRQQRPGYPWGTENRRDPKLPGARKTAATRISLGLGRRRPGYPWGSEDGDPDIPGSRKTAARVSLGHGRRQPGYPWVTENEHEVGWGDGRRAPSCTTIVPAVSGAEPPELDVPRMKKGRVSFFRRMRNRSEQSKAGCSYGNFRRLAK